jgi:hypothetical protein
MKWSLWLGLARKIKKSPKPTDTLLFLAVLATANPQSLRLTNAAAMRNVESWQLGDDGLRPSFRTPLQPRATARRREALGTK